MKFGLFFIHEQPPGKTARQVYQDNLEQCRVADELGFDEVFLGEHRVSEYGTMPDTLVFAGAVSQVTERIRIGTAVVIPAFSHPVRIAEQVAMVDVLSNGRFDLGVGRGYQAKEFRAMNVNQNESAPRFYEATEIIDLLLNQEHVSYQGKFWDVDDVTVYPRPIQHPFGISVAVARTPATFEWVVKKGYNAYAGNPYAADPDIAAGYRVYLETKKAAGLPTGMESVWSIANCFVHEDGERARDLSRPSTELYLRMLARHGGVHGKRGEVPAGYERWSAWDEDNIARAKAGFDETVNLPTTLIGTPDEVIEKMRAMYESFGFQNGILWFNRGGAIAQREVLRSMELFAQKVMPAVRHLGAPVAAKSQEARRDSRLTVSGAVVGPRTRGEEAAAGSRARSAER